MRNQGPNEKVQFSMSNHVKSPQARKSRVFELGAELGFSKYKTSLSILKYQLKYLAVNISFQQLPFRVVVNTCGNLLAVALVVRLFVLVIKGNRSICILERILILDKRKQIIKPHK